MKKKLQSYKFWLIIVLIVAVLISLYTYHIANRYKLLDRTAFNDFVNEVKSVSDSGGFQSRDELSSFLTGWAEDKGLEYTLDKSGNIIFDVPAAGRKKNAFPILVIVGTDYMTAANNAELLASAASVAASDFSSVRKTVIFANNDLETASGFSSLNKKYIRDKSNVIYMDYGPKAYISVNSYASAVSEIKIPAKKEKASLDTAITINISGINPSAIGPEISEHPSVVSEMGNILSRLKLRSVSYRLADFEITPFDNMIPTSVSMTVMINSYSLNSFTKYIDQRIKNWSRSYSRSNPELEYVYEIADSDDALPDKCYNSTTSDLVARMLYTINDGVYKFTESDPAFGNSKLGDIYGFNCISDIAKNSGHITIRLSSQACDETYLNRILMDNHAASELHGCKYNETKHIDAFTNDRNSLLETFRETYAKVYDASGDSNLTISYDDRFTPCSILAEKNTKADIVHLRLSQRSAAKLTNTLLCYINSKGNTFTL